MTTIHAAIMFGIFIGLLFAQDRYYRRRIGRVFDKLAKVEKERDDLGAQLAALWLGDEDMSEWDNDDDDADWDDGTPEDAEALIR